VGLAIALLLVSGALWGAFRSFHHAAGVDAFARLADHDYLADIDALRRQGKFTEALALSQFVCGQPTYPQQPQACRLAEQLQARMRSFWSRARSFGHGALTGTASDGWALAGAATADFFVVGDMRDLVVQSWQLWRGQEADEVLMALSAMGLLTVTVPSLDWVPAFSKVAARLGVLSKRFTAHLLGLSRSAMTTGATAPLYRLFRHIRRLVLRLGPARTLGILPLVEDAEDVASVARLAAKRPQQTYGLLKVGGRQALHMLADTGPETTADLLQAARKGAPGLQLLQRFGRRLFTSHLLVGAGKALHRGRLPQAMSLWLATQTPRIRVLVTVVLGAAWLLTLIALGYACKGKMRLDTR
jgi:hypothetical protein